MIKTAILTLGLLLASSASADSSFIEKEAKKVGMTKDLLLVQIDNYERHTKDLDEVSVSYGNFYDKAGASISYSKILDIDFGSEVANITTGSLEIGSNSSVFTEAEIKNQMLPFVWEDSLLRTLSVITFAKVGTFAGDVTTSKEVPDGFDTKTIKTTNTDRFSKAVLGVGFGLADELFMTNTEVEFTFGKGVSGDIDSELGLKVTTPIFTSRNLNTSLEVGVKHTTSDVADFDSATVQFNFTF